MQFLPAKGKRPFLPLCSLSLGLTEAGSQRGHICLIIHHIQGHLTFGKSEDKGYPFPRPQPATVPHPQMSRQRPLRHLTSQDHRVHCYRARPRAGVNVACQVTKTVLCIFSRQGRRDSGFSTLTKCCGLFARSLGNSTSLFSKDTHLATQHLE